MKAYAFWLASALACSALGDVASALRLVTDWQFADQTDVHNELVFKTERLLMAGDAPLDVHANVVDSRDLLALKAGFDEMARHKLNTFFSFHSSYNFPTDPELLAEYREAFAYARERAMSR